MLFAGTIATVNNNKNIGWLAGWRLHITHVIEMCTYLKHNNFIVISLFRSGLRVIFFFLFCLFFFSCQFPNRFGQNSFSQRMCTHTHTNSHRMSIDLFIIYNYYEILLSICRPAGPVMTQPIEHFSSSFSVFSSISFFSVLATGSN